MKEYAKRKLLTLGWEKSFNAQDTDVYEFITSGGETKDIELYEEKENLDYIKQLEAGYVEREFSDHDNMRIITAGFGKKK